MKIGHKRIFSYFKPASGPTIPLTAVSDSDALAWCNAVGFTTSQWNVVRSVVDQMVIDLKANNFWNTRDRIFLRYGTLVAAKTCIKTLNQESLYNVVSGDLNNGLNYDGTTKAAVSDANLDAHTNLTATSAHFYMAHAAFSTNLGPIGCSNETNGAFSLNEFASS